jgi:hypothetical protein
MDELDTVHRKIVALFMRLGSKVSFLLFWRSLESLLKTNGPE